MVLPKLEVSTEDHTFSLKSGSLLAVPRNCLKRLEASDTKCIKHYMELVDGAKQGCSIKSCPYGFHSMALERIGPDNELIYSAFIAKGIETERPMTKSHPNRVSKQFIDAFKEHEIENRVAIKKKIEGAVGSTLNAVHDLRQLNRSVAKEALNMLRALGCNIRRLDEVKINADPIKRSAFTIHKASELMSSVMTMHDIVENPVRASMGKKNKRTNWHRAFTKVSRIFAPRFREKGIKVEVHQGDDVPTFFSYDSAQLIPLILLDNAIKYSRRDSVVDVKISTDKDRKHIVIRFITEGNVIDIKDIQHLFDLGKRGRDASATDANGSGLGLYVLKIICDVHGGSVEVNSIKTGVFLEGSEQAMNNFTLVLRN